MPAPQWPQFDDYPVTEVEVIELADLPVPELRTSVGDPFLLWRR